MSAMSGTPRRPNVLLGGLVALLVALAATPVPADAVSRLANISTQVRVVQSRFGSSRLVTVRATFDAGGAALFDARRDPVLVSLGDAASFELAGGAPGRRLRGGRVRYRGKERSGAPYLKRLVVFPARGTVRFDVGGAGPSGALFGQDPLPVTLRLGAAEFGGLVQSGSGAVTATPYPFAATDTFPETFVCAPGTVIVNDAAVWSNLWYLHSLDIRPLPAVDFGTSVVVGVFLGARENRGYGARIRSVDERAADIVVTYVESRPSADCQPSPAPICLYAFATVPKSAKPFTFVHTVETDCRLQ